MSQFGVGEHSEWAFHEHDTGLQRRTVAAQPVSATKGTNWFSIVDSVGENRRNDVVAWEDFREEPVTGIANPREKRVAKEEVETHVTQAGECDIEKRLAKGVGNPSDGIARTRTRQKK